ncbi:MAG: EF-P lysine aminoacylase EpmA [Proteobacteria bacterium]|nr:EF-P lysine aminoacylase EpmA [Pseudomonadota bacterium]
MVDWKPGATVDSLRVRAALLAEIRQFFSDRQVLEVETPLLARSTATDIYIQSLSTSISMGSSEETFYLQTSPEYAMKRILGSGVGPIYQICKAFRQAETSRRHNPEFSLLEWYQPGYSMLELMDEVEQLVTQLLNCGKIPRLSYSELFQQILGINPHAVMGDELRAIAESHVELGSKELSDTDYLQLLMTHCIEAQMPKNCFVYDYPVAQCALAQISEDQHGERVAKRFELYCQGMELANGYAELTDPEELRSRFKSDLHARQELGLPIYPEDERLLAAMEQLPDCAGVALGMDRLVMIACEATSIEKVISFTTENI